MAKSNGYRSNALASNPDVASFGRLLIAVICPLISPVVGLIVSPGGSSPLSTSITTVSFGSESVNPIVISTLSQS